MEGGVFLIALRTFLAEYLANFKSLHEQEAQPLAFGPSERLRRTLLVEVTLKLGVASKECVAATLCRSGETIY